MEKLIEVKLIGMVLDPISRTPVMILKPDEEKKIIPIWIGGNEPNKMGDMTQCFGLIYVTCY